MPMAISSVLLVLLALLGLATAVAVFAVARRYRRNKALQSLGCDSPGCVRCLNYRIVSGTAQARLEAYLTSNSGNPTSSPTPPALSELELAPIRKALSTSSTSFSNANIADADPSFPNPAPTVFLFPPLLPAASPFPDPASDPALAAAVALLEDPANLAAIRAEYAAIQLGMPGSDPGEWVSNPSTNTWCTFNLWNQGHRIAATTARCPRTTALLQSLPNFMATGAFGNAMFSALWPGTTITPHCGPTNLRLRLHLTLQAAPGAYLKVAGVTRPWVDGRCLLFDDSFVHSAVYELPDESHESDGKSESKGRSKPSSLAAPSRRMAEPDDRVVLIVDLWHPRVTPSQRALLSHIFTVPSSSS